jgi:hypothetical protein
MLSELGVIAVLVDGVGNKVYKILNKILLLFKICFYLTFPVFSFNLPIENLFSFLFFFFLNFVTKHFLVNLFKKQNKTKKEMNTLKPDTFLTEAAFVKRKKMSN